MKKLTGKVAIVTGASKGIGASIAKQFAAEGASVIVNYSSSKTDADRVVAEIVAHDGKAIAVHGSVAKQEDVTRLFSEAQKHFGTLDILVNNAGVFQFRALQEVDEEEFHRQFNTNVLGTMLSSKEALKYFGPKGGNIINVSSVISEDPLPGSAIYAATKGAIDTLTVGLSRELAGRNIRVNAIAPGGVVTEGSKALGLEDGELGKGIIAKTPLGRLGQPQDIAKVALFLASEESSWLTGERISASGGLR